MGSFQQNQDLFSCVDALGQSGDKAELWEHLLAYLRLMGAKSATYLQLDMNAAMEEANNTILLDGVPNSWVERYIREKLYKVDPAVFVSYHIVEPIELSVAAKVLSLSPDQMHFLEQARSAIGAYGYVVPTFGPIGMDGSVCFFSPEPLPDYKDIDLASIQWACQKFHSRLCALRIAQNGASIKLTDFERDVLIWIAKGQNENEISQVLGRSIETVKLARKDIFRKLGADNARAAIKSATQSGLLRSDKS